MIVYTRTHLAISSFDLKILQQDIFPLSYEKKKFATYFFLREQAIYYARVSECCNYICV